MDEEELGESIRSLVNHFVPVLKDAASVEQAEEILRNAEETDENFHKLDLVTLLNNKIENDLSMVLDKEIERQKLNDRPVHVQMQLQDRVVSNILKSSIYADLRQEVLGHTRQAVARLCEEYVDEEQEMMKDVSRNAGGGRGGTTLGAATSWTGLMSSKRGGGTQYSFSEDSSVGGSSYNPAGFGFIGLDRFQQIVSGLDSNNPTEIRQSAMTNLCRINPADILDEVQNPLKSVILDALLDPDKVLCWKALEMTAKLLSNSCVSLTKSVYVSFIDHVTTQFTGRRSQMLPLMRDGFSLDDSPVAKELLVKFRLMRDFHLHVSKYWIRYPSESLMENVISTTISLFSVKMNATVTGTSGSSDNDVTVFGASSSNCVTPLHCMSLLDPTALWIKNWLHGAFSRVHLLTELTKNPYIVECAANFCMSYYSTRCKNPEADPLIDADKNACLTPRDTSRDVKKK